MLQRMQVVGKTKFFFLATGGCNICAVPPPTTSIIVLMGCLKKRLLGCSVPVGPEGP